MAPTTTVQASLAAVSTSIPAPSAAASSALRLCGGIAASILIIVVFCVVLYWINISLSRRDRHISKIKNLPRKLVLPTILSGKGPTSFLPSATHAIHSTPIAETATPTFISVPVGAFIKHSTRWAESFGTNWRQSIVDIESQTLSIPEPALAVTTTELKTTSPDLPAAILLESLFALNFCTSLSTIASLYSEDSFADIDGLDAHEIFLWIQALQLPIPAIVLTEPTACGIKESLSSKSNVELSDAMIGTTLRDDAFLQLPGKENRPVSGAELSTKRRRRESAAPFSPHNPRSV